MMSTTKKQRKSKAKVKRTATRKVRYQPLPFDQLPVVYETSPIQMVAGETCGAFMADGSPMV
jgi:hypothetical protein